MILQSLPTSHTHPAPECHLPGRGSACTGWSVVAYGHYPLEVTGHPDTGPWWPWGKVHPQHVSSVPPSLRQALLKHNVTAYLNGHLHSAFGDRLHRMHRRGSDGEQSFLYMPGEGRCSLQQVLTNISEAPVIEPAAKDWPANRVQ